MRIEMDNDEALIKAIIGNSEHALERLFQKYFPKLLKYAKLIIPYPTDEAEEVVLDVFTKLWFHREQLHIHTSPASFLYKAVKNRALDYSRKNNLVIQVPIDIAEQEASQAYIIPDQQMSFKELAKGMEQLIGMLPERTQLVFRMSRHDELSYQEIATLLDISINSVKTHMYRAIKFLKESYKVAKSSGHC